MHPGALDSRPQCGRHPVRDRRPLRLRAQAEEKRDAALDRSYAQQDRHPHRGQLLGDRAGQDRPAAARCGERVAEPHDHREQRAGAGLEAQDPGLRRGVLGGDAALGEVGEEVAASARRQLLFLTGLHEDHGEAARGPFGGDAVHRRERRPYRKQHDPRPHRTRTGTAPGHVHQHRTGGRRRVLVLAAQALPHLERVRALGPRPRRVKELAVRGFQEDRVATEVGQDAQDLGDSAAAEQGLRAAAVDLLGLLEQRVVAVDDLGVDLLGDRDERHLAVQLDEGESGRPGRLDEGRGEAGEARAQFDDQGRDAALGEGADERALFRGARAEAVARGQEEFAALEEGGDVRDLARVHPAHGPLEAVGAREDLRQPAAQPGQLQRPLNGDAGALAVECAVRTAVHAADGTCGNAPGTSWARGVRSRGQPP